MKPVQIETPGDITSALKWLQHNFGEETVFIPTNGKASLQRGWTDFTPDIMSEPSHRAEFQLGRNIAAVLGSNSDNLVALDIDSPDIIKGFEFANSWILSAPKIVGSNGAKYLFRIRGAYPKSTSLQSPDGAPRGEWRSGGNSAVVWGRHPDTRMQYEWFGARHTPTVEYAEINWADLILRPRERTCTATLGSTSKLTESEAYRALEASIPRCIPEAARQNDRRLFDLARHVRDYEHQSGSKASLKTLNKVFDLWWELTPAEYLRHTEDDYRAEFIDKFDRTKFGHSDNPLERAWKSAQEEPPPAAAVDLPDMQMKLLSLCYQLHRVNEGKFYLSSYDIPNYLPLTQKTAHRYLSAFCRDGRLILVETGSAARRIANTYKWPAQTYSNDAGHTGPCPE